MSRSTDRKLIFINRFFFPDHSATSQMVSDLAFALAAAGFDVQVVTSRLRYDDPAAELSPRRRSVGYRSTGCARPVLGGTSCPGGLWIT